MEFMGNDGKSNAKLRAVSDSSKSLEQKFVFFSLKFVGFSLDFKDKTIHTLSLIHI